MLGNIQAESAIIADINEISGGGGYGIVQWTPKSKLVNWAKENNLDHKLIGTQCKRILWELQNNVQFYKTKAYPLTFKQFSESRKSPTYLAKVFINNYERPKEPNQPKRGANAEDWYSFFQSNGVDGGSIDTSTGSSTNKNGNNNKVDDDKGASGRWLGTVTGANIKDKDNGYAGILGRAIDGVAVSGRYRYRVHILGGKWLPEVTGFNINDKQKGFAGIVGKKIDGFMIKGLKYRCHTVNGKWYGTVSGYNVNDKNYGYAGVFGKPIDAIIIHGTKYQVHITKK